MFKTVSELAVEYSVPLIHVKNALHLLGIDGHNDMNLAQYVAHGIAKAASGKNSDVCSYTYNIDPVREEFEAAMASISDSREKLFQLQTDIGVLLAAYDADGVEQVYEKISAFCRARKKRPYLKRHNV